jgi:hypothetical protein
MLKHTVHIASTMFHMTITILDIIHRRVFYLKHVSETGFCLRLQVESIQFGTIESWSLCLNLALSIGPN